MSIAFLYAGQGSQKVGMGKDVYEEFDSFKKVIDNNNVGFDLKEMMFENPEGKLDVTRYTQPCMAAFAAGVTNVLFENNIRPDYAAGLSLGEYSALYAAGVFDEKTFIDLVAFRGAVMDDAAKGVECKMTAVMGMESTALSKFCDKVCNEDKTGYVTVSNYNCTGQYVICGEMAAVETVEALAKENGAKRCIPLKVSGPFHTRFMEPAANALHEKFKNITFRKMNCPVIFNTTADFIGENQTIPELLEKQVKSSIYMEDTLKKLSDLGVDKVIEIGPGKALSGFIKKTVKGMEVFNIETAEDLKKVIEAF